MGLYTQFKSTECHIGPGTSKWIYIAHDMAVEVICMNYVYVKQYVFPSFDTRYAYYAMGQSFV